MGNSSTTKSQSADKRDPKTSQDRLSEATSNKTVSDLEESEGISDSESSGPSDVPSPDGSQNPDRGGGRADGSDTGGPM
jgi:hypothetical protein